MCVRLVLLKKMRCAGADEWVRWDAGVEGVSCGSKNCPGNCRSLNTVLTFSRLLCSGFCAPPGIHAPTYLVPVESYAREIGDNSCTKDTTLPHDFRKMRQYD